MKRQHLISIDDLSPTEIKALIQRAQTLKDLPPKDYPNLSSKQAAALFYENSTRTLMSFKVAAQHCHLPLFDLPLQHSSENKGEVLLDTLLNLHAMGITLFIIRHTSSSLFSPLINQIPPDLQFLNAGEGQHEHPTQALLDMMTIMEHFPKPESINIAILGNIKHSRVAHSFQKLCAKLGITQLRFIAPSIWHPTTGWATEDLAEGLANADVIMTLRVQKERIAEHEAYDLTQYQQKFGLTSSTLALAKPGALIFHPGPMNRGLEISSEVADGPQSQILKQVKNGVFMRMAILERLLGDVLN